MNGADAIEALARRVRANVERVIVGKPEIIEHALVAVLCEGHILIEDVPGIGKTMLAKALARSLGCTFRRIQCTPDLLPADITGLDSSIKGTGLEFRPGPIFSQVVLADEITGQRRHAVALLECMRAPGTVEGQTRRLRVHSCAGDANTVELQGTFPLPEAARSVLPASRSAIPRRIKSKNSAALPNYAASR